MAAQALPFAFWALVAFALVGVVFDVRALRVEGSRTLAVTAITLKALVLLAFGAWWIYFRVLGIEFQGFADLAVLVSIMLLAIPALAAALVCEGLAMRKMRQAA